MRGGQYQGTMCLTEAHAGSALADIKTQATIGDDGHWYVKGTKVFITNGEHDLCENHVHLVLARTPGAPKGIKGISLFVVPKIRVSADGSLGDANDVVCSGIEHKMGIHASPTCVMQFGESDGCRGWLVGQEGRGIIYMFHMMNHARIGVGMQALGLGAQAYLYAQAYARERVQGTSIEAFKDPDAERVAISQHPNVRRMLLWCKATVEGCRALLYTTAFYADMAQYGPDEKREHYQGLLEFLTPVCKAYISDQNFEVTRLAMQSMGGYGYIAEYPVERFMRDIKIASIYEGTNGIQALDLIGRKLPAKSGAYFRALMKQIQDFTKEHKEHEALANEVAAFSKRADQWIKVTMELGMKGMGGDKAYPVLCASPYLKMTGHTVCAWLLLKQAIAAQAQLVALIGDDLNAKRSEIEESSEATFFFNKIQTAKFFTHNILTENDMISAQVASDDRSALDYI